MENNKSRASKWVTNQGVKIYPPSSRGYWRIVWTEDGKPRIRATPCSHESAEIFSIGNKASSPAQMEKGSRNKCQNGEKSSEILFQRVRPLSLGREIWTIPTCQRRFVMCLKLPFQQRLTMKEGGRSWELGISEVRLEQLIRFWILLAPPPALEDSQMPFVALVPFLMQQQREGGTFQLMIL